MEAARQACPLDRSFPLTGYKACQDRFRVERVQVVSRDQTLSTKKLLLNIDFSL